MKGSKRAKVLAVILIGVMIVSTIQLLATPLTSTNLTVDVKYNSQSITRYSPQTEATVTLLDNSLKPVRGAQTISGEATFQGVPNGHYTLSVSWLWFSRNSSVELSGWSQTVTVDLAVSS